jgi:hypothetical protein
VPLVRLLQGPGRHVRLDRIRMGSLVGRGRNDKKRARLNISSHLRSQVPGQPLAHRDVKLPRRQQPDGYVPPELPLRHVGTPF